jgi:hypothetical protein
VAYLQENDKYNNSSADDIFRRDRYFQEGQMANRTLSLIKRVYSFGISRDVIDHIRRAPGVIRELLYFRKR